MINVQHLSAFYDTAQEKREVLHDISFSVNAGEFVCIVGASGSGKTTLLRCLVGLDTQYEGMISIQNTPTRTYIQQHPIAFVSQKYSQYPWLTVEQNIRLGNRQADDARIRAILQRFGLLQRRDAYPGQLSGGMQQRVAIARALIQDTEYIFFDEPFGALDAHIRSQMQEFLLQLWSEEKKTILFVTHDVDEALYLADRVYILGSNPGKIQEIVDVPLSRPRTSDIQFSDEFIRLKKSILYTIRAESIKTTLEHPTTNANTYRFGIFIWSGNAPWYYAYDANLYAKEGLHIDLLPIESNQNGLEKLLNNELDILNVTLDFGIRSLSTHPELQIVLPLNYSQGSDALISSPHITNVSELVGKRIGIEKHAVSHFFLLTVLQKNGIAIDDVIEVDMLGGEMGSALIRGDIDAAVLWEPWLSKAIELSNATVLASTKEKKYQVLYDVLMSKKDFIAHEKKYIQGLSTIWNEAIQVIHSPAAIKSVASRMGISEKEISIALQKIHFINMATPDFFRAMKEIQKIYTQQGIIDEVSSENIESYFYNLSQYI